MRKIYLIILIFISSFIFSQTNLTSTNQVWTRYQIEYEHPKFISNNQIENRYDLISNKSLMRFRTQITTNTKVKVGAGINYICLGFDELRYHQIIHYDVPRLIFEERVFETGTRYRIRYQILPEIEINEKNKLNIGLEYFIQCSDYKTFKSEQTRFTFNYIRIANTKSKIVIGYAACVFQKDIVHAIRLTLEVKFKKKTLGK